MAPSPFSYPESWHYRKPASMILRNRWKIIFVIVTMVIVLFVGISFLTGFFKMEVHQKMVETEVFEKKPLQKKAASGHGPPSSFYSSNVQYLKSSDYPPVNTNAEEEKNNANDGGDVADGDVYEEFESKSEEYEDDNDEKEDDDDRRAAEDAEDIVIPPWTPISTKKLKCPPNEYETIHCVRRQATCEGPVIRSTARCFDGKERKRLWTCRCQPGSVRLRKKNPKSRCVPKNQCPIPPATVNFDQQRSLIVYQEPPQGGTHGRGFPDANFSEPEPTSRKTEEVNANVEGDINHKLIDNNRKKDKSRSHKGAKREKSRLPKSVQRQLYNAWLHAYYLHMTRNKTYPPGRPNRNLDDDLNQPPAYQPLLSRKVSLRKPDESVKEKSALSTKNMGEKNQKPTAANIAQKEKNDFVGKRRTQQKPIKVRADTLASYSYSSSTSPLLTEKTTRKKQPAGGDQEWTPNETDKSSGQTEILLKRVAATVLSSERKGGQESGVEESKNLLKSGSKQNPAESSNNNDSSKKNKDVTINSSNTQSHKLHDEDSNAYQNGRKHKNRYFKLLTNQRGRAKSSKSIFGGESSLQRAARHIQVRKEDGMESSTVGQPIKGGEKDDMLMNFGNPPSSYEKWMAEYYFDTDWTTALRSSDPHDDINPRRESANFSDLDSEGILGDSSSGFTMEKHEVKNDSSQKMKFLNVHHINPIRGVEFSSFLQNLTSKSPTSAEVNESPLEHRNFYEGKQHDFDDSFAEYGGKPENNDLYYDFAGGFGDSDDGFDSFEEYGGKPDDDDGDDFVIENDEPENFVDYFAGSFLSTGREKDPGGVSADKSRLNNNKEKMTATVEEDSLRRNNNDATHPFWKSVRRQNNPKSSSIPSRSRPPMGVLLHDLIRTDIIRISQRREDIVGGEGIFVEFTNNNNKASTVLKTPSSNPPENTGSSSSLNPSENFTSSPSDKMIHRKPKESGHVADKIYETLFLRHSSSSTSTSTSTKTSKKEAPPVSTGLFSPFTKASSTTKKSATTIALTGPSKTWPTSSTTTPWSPWMTKPPTPAHLGKVGDEIMAEIKNRSLSANKNKTIKRISSLAPFTASSPTTTSSSTAKSSSTNPITLSTPTTQFSTQSGGNAVMNVTKILSSPTTTKHVPFTTTSSRKPKPQVITYTHKTSNTTVTTSRTLISSSSLNPPENSTSSPSDKIIKRKPKESGHIADKIYQKLFSKSTKSTSKLFSRRSSSSTSTSTKTTKRKKGVPSTSTGLFSPFTKASSTTKKSATTIALTDPSKAWPTSSTTTPWSPWMIKPPTPKHFGKVGDEIIAEIKNRSLSANKNKTIKRIFSLAPFTASSPNTTSSSAAKSSSKASNPITWPTPRTLKTTQFSTQSGGNVVTNVTKTLSSPTTATTTTTTTHVPFTTTTTATSSRKPKPQVITTTRKTSNTTVTTTRTPISSSSWNPPENSTSSPSDKIINRKPKESGHVADKIHQKLFSKSTKSTSKLFSRRSSSSTKTTTIKKGAPSTSTGLFSTFTKASSTTKKSATTIALTGPSKTWPTSSTTTPWNPWMTKPPAPKHWGKVGDEIMAEIKNRSLSANKNKTIKRTSSLAPFTASSPTTSSSSLVKGSSTNSITSSTPKTQEKTQFFTQSGGNAVMNVTKTLSSLTTTTTTKKEIPFTSTTAATSSRKPKVITARTPIQIQTSTSRAPISGTPRTTARIIPFSGSRAPEFRKTGFFVAVETAESSGGKKEKAKQRQSGGILQRIGVYNVDKIFGGKVNKTYSLKTRAFLSDSRPNRRPVLSSTGNSTTGNNIDAGHWKARNEIFESDLQSFVLQAAGHDATDEIEKYKEGLEIGKERENFKSHKRMETGHYSDRFRNKIFDRKYDNNIAAPPSGVRPRKKTGHASDDPVHNDILVNKILQNYTKPPSSGSKRRMEKYLKQKSIYADFIIQTTPKTSSQMLSIASIRPSDKAAASVGSKKPLEVLESRNPKAETTQEDNKATHKEEEPVQLNHETDYTMKELSEAPIVLLGHNPRTLSPQIRIQSAGKTTSSPSNLSRQPGTNALLKQMFTEWKSKSHGSTRTRETAENSEAEWESMRNSSRRQNGISSLTKMASEGSEYAHDRGQKTTAGKVEDIIRKSANSTKNQLQQENRNSSDSSFLASTRGTVSVSSTTLDSKLTTKIDKSNSEVDEFDEDDEEYEDGDEEDYYEDENDRIEPLVGGQFPDWLLAAAINDD